MAEPTREVITITKVDTSRPNKVGVQVSDNRWFGVFDRKLWPRLEEGAHLNVEWIVAGDSNQYRNIVGILGTASSPNGTVPTDRERNIIREAALKASCQLYSRAEQSQTDVSIDWILHTADRFVAWITDTEDAPF